MTLTYDLFWSFRSPYSYLVTARLLELEREFDVVPCFCRVFAGSSRGLRCHVRDITLRMRCGCLVSY
jgi:hypothetical protein